MRHADGAEAFRWYCACRLREHAVHDCSLPPRSVRGKNLGRTPQSEKVWRHAGAKTTARGLHAITGSGRHRGLVANVAMYRRGGRCDACDFLRPGAGAVAQRHGAAVAQRHGHHARGDAGAWVFWCQGAGAVSRQRRHGPAQPCRHGVAVRFRQRRSSGCAREQQPDGTAHRCCQRRGDPCPGPARQQCAGTAGHRPSGAVACA